MEDDLKALKKGQLPSGVELQKVPDKTPVVRPATPGPVPAPLPSQAPRPGIQIELGKPEKAKTLSGFGFKPDSTPAPVPAPVPPVMPQPSKTIVMPKPTPTPSIPVAPRPVAPSSPYKPVGAVPAAATPSSLSVPHAGVGSKKLILSVVIVIVLGLAGFLGYSLFQGKIGSTPTPTPVVIEPSPTPTPVDPMQTIFGISQTTAAIPTSGDPYVALKDFITAQTIDIGGMKFYKVTDETGNRYSFPAMLARFVINHPVGMNSTDQNSEMLLSLYGAINSGKNVGIVVPIPSTDINSLPNSEPSAAMTEWEKTMAKDLATLFGLNTKKQASKTFLSNTYNGVSVRYLNFNSPDSTIDYAFVNAPSGLSFLIIANSRSHIFSLIDRVIGF